MQDGKYKPICKDQSKLDIQLQREKQYKEKLAGIVERLIVEFPAAKLALERVTCSYGFIVDDKEYDSWWQCSVDK